MSPSLLVFPVGKVLHVADDAVVLPGSTKPSVINLWEVVRTPGQVFPYVLGKVCVVAWMRDGLGSATFRVDIVDAANNTVIRDSKPYTVLFSSRSRSELVVIRLMDVAFPHTGMYLVELFCNDVFIDDQSIQVL